MNDNSIVTPLFVLIAFTAAVAVVYLYIYADCDTLIKFTWSVKDLPVRCLHEAL